VQSREVRYARSGEVNIAYQVVGNGPVDLVFVPGFVSHLELDWDEPRSARFLERLASFSRLIRFDKRGTGLSDRPGGLPDLETRMDDVRAVMDAVSVERAALFGYSEGGPMSVLFAATYPERTTALVLYGTYAKRRDPTDDYPWARRASSAGNTPRNSRRIGRGRRTFAEWRPRRTTSWRRGGRGGCTPRRAPAPHAT
jgi:pimeloyl-ACP methyl ester carboxylesterase